MLIKLDMDTLRYNMDTFKNTFKSYGVIKEDFTPLWIPIIFLDSRFVLLYYLRTSPIIFKPQEND